MIAGEKYIYMYASGMNVEHFMFGFYALQHCWLRCPEICLHSMKVAYLKDIAFMDFMNGASDSNANEKFGSKEPLGIFSIKKSDDITWKVPLKQEFLELRVLYPV